MCSRGEGPEVGTAERWEWVWKGWSSDPCCWELAVSLLTPLGPTLTSFSFPVGGSSKSLSP